MTLYTFLALPILFILHDFEEMIFMPLWKKSDKFQHLQDKERYFGGVTDGSAFCIGVLEEFIILLIIALIVNITHITPIYLGFCIAYFIHFFLHFKLCITYKGYVPGVITVLCQIPIMILIIHHYFTWTLSSLIYIIIAIIITYINLYIMHKAMPVIQRILHDLIKRQDAV